jgi:hypothetical protein
MTYQGTVELYEPRRLIRIDLRTRQIPSTRYQRPDRVARHLH